jgi:hypothetical protein
MRRALSLALVVSFLFLIGCSSPSPPTAPSVSVGPSSAGAPTTGAPRPDLPEMSSACTPGSGRTLHVTPADLAASLASAAPGDTLLLEPGRYEIPYVEGSKNTLVLSQQGTAEQPIRVITEAGRAELDFSFPDQIWVQDSYGLLVSGSYWSFCRVDITRAGYQGVYVTGEHNTFQSCTFHDNRNSGLEINKGGAHTAVIDCDSYRNYDPKRLGEMADGFAPKQTQGPGNRFIGCRAWENSDDGFDTYDSPESVSFERCWAFRNGLDVWGYGGFDGNGNGFKLGGNGKQANHRVVRGAAFANRVKGFDQNNNTGGITLLNCTGFDNGTDFALGGALNPGQRHDLRNNVALGSKLIANAGETHNSWNLGLSLSAADFLDLDPAHGSAARQADGTLPAGNFMRPSQSSPIRDAGTDVGLPFSGAAPDLGALEGQ